MAYYVGVDLGGTNTKAGVVDDSGSVLAVGSALTEVGRGAEHALGVMARLARQVAADAGLDWEEIAAVGLGSPGTMDLREGVLLDPVNLRGPGWRNFAIRDRLSAELGKPVAFQNDANAAAYGEYWAGAGRAYESLVFWTLGTGVGCGIIIGDVIVEGRHSHGAECGHIVIEMRDARRCGCGQYGHLEAYASATALVARAREALEGGRRSSLGVMANETLTAQEIGEHAERGDEVALELVLETARYLGVGTVNLMHTIDPDVVVIGGAMTFGREENALGRRFLEELRAEVRRRAFPVPGERTEIVYASLGGDAGFIGAAGCARRLGVRG